MTLRRVGFILALCSAALALAGCAGVTNAEGQPTTLTAAAPAPVAVGEALPILPAEGEVRVYSAKWMKDTGDRFPIVPDNGAFLVLDVGLSVKAGAYVVSEYDWTATDAAGKAWPCLSNQWFDPYLRSGKVSAGSQTRGTMACDMPRGAAVVNLKGSGGWSVPA